MKTLACTYLHPAYCEGELSGVVSMRAERFGCGSVCLKSKFLYSIKDRSMQVVRISTLTDLAPLADSWNQLAGDVPFRRHEWLESWWQHYGDHHELYVLAIIDFDGSVIGLAPLYLENSHQGRTLRLLGSGEVCTDYLTILSLSGNRKKVAIVLAEWLVDNSIHDPWDLLWLENVPSSDAGVACLVEALWHKGFSVHRSQGIRCWRISLPETWDKYLAMMSRSHRKQLRRIGRRDFDTGRAILRTVKTSEELELGMEILVDLHQKRRLSLNEPGCFASSQFAGFLHQTAPRLLASGQLRLHWLELEGVPVAVEFQLCGEKTTYAYQAGVDPTHLDDEPGSLINIATIQQAIEEGKTGFDFLRGDEAYKAHWRAVPIETTNVRVVPNRVSSQMRHNVWLAGNRIKDWIKVGLARTGKY